METLYPTSATRALRTVELRQSLLEGNDRQASRNRRLFRELGLVALNLVSSPGSGKTALLERTLAEFGRTTPCAAVVGDLATDNDARRLGRSKAPVAQITTGSACHLDAGMVARAIAGMDLAGARLLFIENVGNLVCPASFDLGESVRVVLLSSPEGEDKPLKYPPIFKTAHVVLITKTDVAGVLGFDREAAARNVRRMAPQARLIQLSSRSGEGMQEWYDLLGSLVPKGMNPWSPAPLQRQPRPPAPTSSCGCAGWSRAWDSGRSCTGRRRGSASAAGSATIPRGSLSGPRDPPRRWTPW